MLSKYDKTHKKTGDITGFPSIDKPWLKYYEKPYDAYDDDYYTLSFERAAWADEIEKACTAKEEE